MKKRNILILSIPTILAAVTLISCNTISNNENKLNDYVDAYNMKIDSKTKTSIEDAYKNTFGNELVWSSPYETNSFNSKDELNEYILASYGLRLYGIYNDKYLLCEFSGPSYAADIYTYTMDYYALYYNDIALIDNNNIWNVKYKCSYIYSNGEITKLTEGNIDSESADISYYLDIKEEDALEIKSVNDSYNSTFFNKFMTEDDKSVNDAFSRILNSFNKKETNDNKSSTNTTTAA